MKPLIVSESDILGGAARAAYRLHRALWEAGTPSHMLVQRKLSDDWTVTGPTTPARQALALVRSRVGQAFMCLQRSPNPVLHSPAFIPSGLHRRINRSDADVINLHWVGGEMLSVAEIGKIRKSLVWTLHDTWAFCGTEHYATLDDNRYRSGYRKANRPSDEHGIDLDRWAWRRKVGAWKKPITIVCPSNWLADRVRQSELMHDWPVHVIPNTLNTDVYQPIDKQVSRKVLGLPDDLDIVLFGALDGDKDPRKGQDLLLLALQHLNAFGIQNLMCVVFGQLEPPQQQAMPFPIRWMGHCHDDWSLVLLYNAADVLVLPSRQENLPQCGTEAQACGCPIVAFNATGLSDVVEHLRTGYLARPFEPGDLAQGIAWVLENQERASEIAKDARARSTKLWNAPKIAQQYIDLYGQVGCHRAGSLKS